VSSTATNLCVPSNPAFIVVCVTCKSIISNEEQRICIKICFMLEKAAFKMHKMLKTAHSANAMGSTQVVEKFYQFKPGDAMVEGRECSGHWSHRQKLEKVHKTTKDQ